MCMIRYGNWQLQNTRCIYLNIGNNFFPYSSPVKQKGFHENLRLWRSVILAGSSYIWINAVCKLTNTGVVICHEWNSTLKHERVGDTQSHKSETWEFWSSVTWWYVVLCTVSNILEDCSVFSCKGQAIQEEFLPELLASEGMFTHSKIW
jgi:hypothetical protein